MIRRFFYHAFWNFYDYLGTLTLAGTLYAIALFGGMFAVMLFAEALTGIIPTLFLVSFVYVLSVAFLPGLLGYCARAARGEPARWPDLRIGFKTHAYTVAAILAVWLLIAIVLYCNVVFYFNIQSQFTTEAVRITFIALAAIVTWLSAVWLAFLPPWLAAATAAGRTTVRQSFRRALMVAVITPGCWFWVGLILLGILLSAFYLRITFIFLLPVLTSLSHTAYQLVAQYTTFLSQGREELGPDLPVSQYKARAMELAWQWEYRQPRRTLKELIRPWEY